MVRRLSPAGNPGRRRVGRTPQFDAPHLRDDATAPIGMRAVRPTPPPPTAFPAHTMTLVEPLSKETVVRVRPRRQRGRSRRHAAAYLDWAVLGVITALGLVKLAFPFTGDQAMFMVGARSTRHGAVLYGGFWDIKQPAIYLFFLLAGTLDGYNEVSVHLLELVTLLGFSYALQRAGR